MCVCVWIYICVCVGGYICVYMCVFVRIYMCVGIYMCGGDIYVCVCVRLQGYIRLEDAYIYMCVCVCVCVCVYKVCSKTVVTEAMFIKIEKKKYG